ncbi:hypothetical protein [Phytohabitans houttuyneae]|uniref:Bacterial spore germination immunoglobulin-like domain-containing protein n=1 Tax=Phytohabitans houttuyneae TaxID=1076126 RepID=A0A6V8KHN7_9ACTN|nr:hypothetical protein [Phytohabitans houttuyneae]GFJ82910.1 hypothetical protein Phou_070900 [Phytohabitans houttuyneae]
MPETNPPPDESGIQRLRRLGPSIRDDAGTRYVLVSSGMGGTGSEWRGEWSFRPGPPPAARTLHVEAADSAGHHTMSIAIPPA